MLVNSYMLHQLWVLGIEKTIEVDNICNFSQPLKEVLVKLYISH
jgi:hypothetical protein